MTKTEQNEDNSSYKPYKNLGCTCRCGKHCGHSCMTDDCDCVECQCFDCRENAEKYR